MERKHPAGLYVAFLTGFWQCFGFWGVLSLLVIYLTKAFSFPDSEAYAFYSCYSALAWATPVLGGFIADRFLGYRTAVGIGLVLSIVGNLILTVPHSGLFLYVGLAFLTCGIGFFYSNNNNLVGTLYETNDPRRDRGFTILSVATNIGGLLGPITYGFVAIHYSWHYNFLISAIGDLIVTIIFIAKRNLFANKTPTISSSSLPISWVSKHINKWLLLLLPIILGAVSLLLSHPLATGNLLNICGVIVLGMWSIFVFRSNMLDKKRIFLLLLMAVFCLIFYAGELQTTSSLILFTDREVNRNIFGLVFPSTAVASLEPFFFIAISPLLVRVWTKLSAHNVEPIMPTKIAMGLLFGALGFVIFGLGAHHADISGKCSLLWVLGGSLVLAVAELCILPSLISGITKLAPANLKGTFMGTFYLALAYAGYLSGVIAKLTSPSTGNANLKPAVQYIEVYAKICIGMAIVGLIAYAVALLLRKRYTLYAQNP
jgi:POT family proton-dependent oligopeptide transporter